MFKTLIIGSTCQGESAWNDEPVSLIGWFLGMACAGLQPTAFHWLISLSAVMRLSLAWLSLLVGLLCPHAILGCLQLDVGKLVIDTDAGGDDAVAILLTLGQDTPQHDVIAITCVRGNTLVDNVVVNVLKTLDTVNRLDIPVYKGASKSVHITPKDDFFFGVDGFGDFEYPNAPDPDQYLKKEHAVNALIAIVTENPGEVTILCLGPLTNIALAIRLDPLFLTKVRQLVVLGGSVEGFGNVLPGIEFNFFTDPEATFIVFNSTDTSVENINPIILFPWESVAKRHIIPIDWRVSVLGALDSPQVRLLNQAEAAVLGEPEWQCGDGLAAAVTVNSSLVHTAAAHYLHVETSGAVLVDYQNSLKRPPNALIVQALDLDAYKDMLLDSLAQRPAAYLDSREEEPVEITHTQT